MKRMMIALATAAGLSLAAGRASADPGGFSPPGPGNGAMPSWAQIGGPNTLMTAGDAPAERGPDRYGLHPCLKKFFHIPSGGYAAGSASQKNYGKNPLQNPANWAAGGYGMGGPAYNPYGPPSVGPGGGPMGGPGMMGPGMMGMGQGMPPGMGSPYGPYCPPGMGAPGNPMMQGTLVFPNQPFIRSPRDYFMVDVNK
jgi:hypothetical protein